MLIQGQRVMKTKSREGWQVGDRVTILKLAIIISSRQMLKNWIWISNWKTRCSILMRLIKTITKKKSTWKLKSMNKYKKTNSFWKKSLSNSSWWKVWDRSRQRRNNSKIGHSTTPITNNQFNKSMDIIFLTAQAATMTLSTNRISRMTKKNLWTVRKNTSKNKKKQVRNLNCRKYSIEIKIIIFKGCLCNRCKICRFRTNRTVLVLHKVRVCHI